jgi:hypothetical protein
MKNRAARSELVPPFYIGPDGSGNFASDGFGC